MPEQDVLALADGDDAVEADELDVEDEEDLDDDELDDDEDDDDEADEIDFTEDRYGRIPGEDDADA
jgi:RNA polymerase primary sigma factor